MREVALVGAGMVPFGERFDSGMKELLPQALANATTCLALPVFRRRGDVGEAKFRAPFGAAAAVLSLILIAWLLTDERVLTESLPILVAIGIGLAIYFAYRYIGKPDTTS